LNHAHLMSKTLREDDLAARCFKTVKSVESSKRSRMFVPNLMGTPTVDPRFEDLHKRAMDAFATAAIFQRRAETLEWLIRMLTYFGLVIPIIIGGIVLGSLADPILLAKFVYVAGVLIVVQVVLFLWSVVANWPDRLNYASAANAMNTRLSNQLKALAIQAARPPADFDVRFTELQSLDDAQQTQDKATNISATEEIYGHRSALRQFEVKCIECGVKPASMEMPFSKKKRCPVCGGPKKK
jgi:mobilome CxxCx(11)CxxC protein